VGNRPLNPYLSRLQGSALLLAIGANLLVWTVLALSAAGLYGPPFGVYSAATPVLHAASAPSVSITPSPTFASSMSPMNDRIAVPLSDHAGVPPLPMGDHVLVLALLGVDTARTSSVWRTDTIILVFVEQEAKRVGMLSIPRDLWVYIPGHGYSRINTVDALGERILYPGGGLTLLDATLRHNLGVPVDHYVRIDFSGFVRIVDAVGGVTVNVEKPVADIFPDPPSPTGVFKMDLPAGSQHLDGRTTLAYCRSRSATSDFDRARRQQKVLAALWKQAFTPETLAQAPQLWATFSDALETDLTKGEAVRLANLVYGIEPHNLRSQRLDAAMVTAWTTPQGAQVLLPQTDAIRKAILELLSPPG
jgi:LCP family protein required for cell wall assembly